MGGGGRETRLRGYTFMHSIPQTKKGVCIAPHPQAKKEKMPKRRQFGAAAAAQLKRKLFGASATAQPRRACLGPLPPAAAARQCTCDHNTLYLADHKLREAVKAHDIEAVMDIFDARVKDVRCDCHFAEMHAQVISARDDLMYIFCLEPAGTDEECLQEWLDDPAHDPRHLTDFDEVHQKHRCIGGEAVVECMRVLQSRLLRILLLDQRVVRTVIDHINEILWDTLEEAKGVTVDRIQMLLDVAEPKTITTAVLSALLALAVERDDPAFISRIMQVSPLLEEVPQSKDGKCVTDKALCLAAKTGNIQMVYDLLKCPRLTCSEYLTAPKLDAKKTTAHGALLTAILHGKQECAKLLWPAFLEDAFDDEE